MQRSPTNIDRCRLRFKDFIPERLSKGGLFSSSQYQSLAELLVEIEDWRKQNSRYKITQIETVVLPNIHHSREEGSQDPEIKIHGDLVAKWHQLFRVWYEVG